MNFNPSRIRTLVFTAALLLVASCRSNLDRAHTLTPPPADNKVEKAPVDPTPPPEIVEAPIDTAARVKPGDRFTLHVFGESDLSGDLVVLSDGSVRHSLLGRVPVAGLSMIEIETRFTELLAKDYLVKPKVSVQFNQKEKQSLVVNGQVAKPGVYEFDRNVPMSLLKAIASAGGFTDIAKESGVKIVRVEDGKEIIIPVNVADLLSGKKPDILLKDGDRVWVPESIF